jgi:twitching motility protein PilT
MSALDPKVEELVADAAISITDTPLRRFFEVACKHEASDLIIKPGTKPRIRLKGELRSIDAEPFTDEGFEEVIDGFLTDAQKTRFKKQGYVDLAYDYDEDNRFRVNIFRQRGHSALSARRVSSEILSYEDLNLPESLGQIAQTNQGLILLCGVTGCGKSTTIASMIQQINENRPCHIVTLEDPIEFIFKDDKAVVSQREAGVDFRNFHEGLRSMVRENPDVILIGEMRDRETFEAALHAAETGHLVFGTIHASSSSQAFGRIYNLFPQEERDLIREMLAGNLVAIIYQKLLPSIIEESPRVPAVEILINNPVVRKYIYDGRESELGDVIRSNRDSGMIDFTSSLVDLVKSEYIHPRVAMANAMNADELKMRLKGIQSSG